MKPTFFKSGDEFRSWLEKNHDKQNELLLGFYKKAWEFFQAQPPGYQRVISWWIVNAKQEETRFRRVERLIRDSESGRRVGILEKKK